MKIYDNLKEMSLIQCFITLHAWYYRLNNQWNRLVKNNGSKYDWLRVPAVIFALSTLFLLAYIPAEALAVGSAESHNIWVAYTIGDVSFVHSVLRAVSMIMYGDGGVIQGAYRLAALLGVIWLIVRGVFSKDGLNLGSGLFVILFYMCFFVPQSTLHIEDMQTKKFYTMDKIPLGVSATLSVVSKIGKYLSDSYESVFIDVSSDNGVCSAGSMECNGYMGTLDMLAKARSSLQNSAAYVAINQSMCNSTTEYSNCDIEVSLLNYIRDCTIHKITNPNEGFSLKNVKSFTNNENTSYEVKFDSKRHKVNVYLGNGKTGLMTCQDAGIAIEQAFSQSRVKNTIFKLASPVHNMNPHDGGSVADGGTGTDNGTTTGRNNVAAFQGMMNEALSGLGGSTTDSYEYLRNVIMEPIIEEGLRGGYIDQNMSAARISLDTAIAQRDIQLAAESSMFATMIRPLSTFLEGFVLALTPIMPFIILISLNGFAICMKYLMVLLWIQLWAPALAICNMYVQSVAKENLAIALYGTDITSLAGISRATPVIQHWLAVGGMMGASVPVLTLFILSGSIYTFNSLATSMKGSDHFDEKAIQPDAIKRTAYINDSVGSFNASSGGMIEAGTQARYMTFTNQDLYNIEKQAAKSRAIEKANQYTNSVINALSRSTNTQEVMSLLENCADQFIASNDQQFIELFDTVAATNDKLGAGLTQTQQKSFTAATFMGFDTSFISGLFGFGGDSKDSKAKSKNGGKGTINASMGVNASSQQQDIYQRRQELAKQIAINTSHKQNSSDATAIRDSINHNIASQDLSSITKAVNEQDVSSINKAYTAKEAAQQSYQEAEKRSYSSSSSISMQSSDIASLVYGDANKNYAVREYLKNNTDTWSMLSRTAQNKGFSSGMTGVFTAAVEYALVNNDTTSEELRNVMGLDAIMPGYTKNDISEKDQLLGINPSETNNNSFRGQLMAEYNAQIAAQGKKITNGRDLNYNKKEHKGEENQDKINQEKANAEENFADEARSAQKASTANVNETPTTPLTPFVKAGKFWYKFATNKKYRGQVGKNLSKLIK